jgi:hypothetical protein
MKPNSAKRISMKRKLQEEVADAEEIFVVAVELVSKRLLPFFLGCFQRRTTISSFQNYFDKNF